MAEQNGEVTDESREQWLVRRATLIAGLVTAALVVVVWGSVQCFLTKPTWPQLAELASSGRTALATATTTDPGDHSHCTFTYTVRGRQYGGSTACPVTRVGATFNVTYDPHGPSVVTPNNPTSALLGDVVLVLIAAGGFGVVVAGGLRAVYARLAGKPVRPRSRR